ncbi:MAG: Tol-Pal system protein TolB [Alphaproteobacteria bacterium]|nr:Tol-Pal system protein TolB [Alphaproteobacteria bacterium]MBP7757641.1 Tol-Pal system protein TolB [Alphaproteobacteria bacterium]MBP7761159.1 Tol-Pal system protein TolB [Alphaproteobacteria bacterium]MBP7905158.1 Tol-Pal system protein TolB [Alphaproteobacteria bacterium]
MAMFLRSIRLFAVFSLVVMLSAFPAFAQETEIVIDRPNMKPRPIAISSFFADSADSERLAADIPGIVTANLERSGLFAPINPRAFVQAPASIEQEGVRFAEWRATGAEALVTGRVTRAGNGQSRVEFRLWDVFNQQQLIGMAYTTTDANWRRIAHIMSDEIYKRITGEGAYFDSRVVYVSEYGPANKRVKRLAIMDQDGANHKYLTDGSYLVLTPRFSPETQRITYLSYQGGKPRVFLYDLGSGRHTELGTFPGMTFAPRFSPDGRRIIMSLARGGNTDIYVMDVGSRNPVRITNTPGIDTAPSYSPDGSQIVFESDRGGSQQLYVMSADGSGAKRITFGKGRYASPVWSPRGDWIAFTRMYQGKFYIGVIRADGTGERLISNAYHVEGPSWSPNGRVLTYFKETPAGGSRSAKLYTIDITGYNERVLKTPRDGSDPAWSPINP